MRENAHMPRHKAKLHAAMGGTPDEVEAAFYEALQQGDLEKLMDCWADEDDIACIHPGGGRLSGVGAIRAAFEAMFAHGGGLDVQLEHVRRVDALGSAVHHVWEKVTLQTSEDLSDARHAFVIATNVYHKTPQGWRMVVHHASAGAAEDVNPHLRATHVLH
jgi:uncharacterized protein (TIGR02246 family)